MAKLTEGLTDTRGADLKPGEARIIQAKDRSGNVIKMITLHRTDRPCVHDLCDAYNDARTDEAIERGIEWFVAPNGELKIGDSNDWSRKNLKRIESRNETERARHNRMQLEAARRANAYEREAAE